MALLAAMTGIGAMAQDFGPETYDCYIDWKWGFIDMTAAHAHINVQCQNGNFFGTMDGSSIPWEGRVFTVSDTLRCSVTPEKACISYINGWYSKPKEGQPANFNNPASFHTLMGQGTLSASDATMEAVRITANMLNMFYYSRALDLNGSDEAIYHIPLEGPNGEQNTLRISFKGRGPSRANPNYSDVYYAVLDYTIDGEYTGYPVSCEIDASSRIPVYFASNIKIGHVEMNINI